MFSNDEWGDALLVIGLTRLWKMRHRHGIVTRLDMAFVWAFLLALLHLVRRRER